MKQNHYDNQEFFDKYSNMDRSKKGLDAAGEWKTLESLLPDFKGKRVLDLGCGFGWHCRYAKEHGAQSVTGVDLSEKMLARAKAMGEEGITYLRDSIEDVEFPERTFDVVISSLAFHYVVSFEKIVEKVNRFLVSGGDFVFSAEHPTFTAEGSQDWYYSENGEILHFPVDRYFNEGERQAVFLGETIVKYHKTLTTYLNGLIQGGFEITAVVEPKPAEHLMNLPGMKEELRRPMMLIVAARKK